MQRFSAVRFRVAAVLILTGTLTGGATVARAQEIGFIEDFSLAPERAEVLQQLIPGTDDHYFYQCLHLQNNQQFDRVDKLLADWIRRHNVTARVREIQHRQALLTYGRNPRKTLEYIQKQLALRFDHQRDTVDRAARLPTELDPQLISRERLAAEALRRHRNNLNGFEDSALDWLAAEPLDVGRRRDLIQRMQRPDVPGLAKLIVDDLNSKNSSGFGSFGIHGNLLKGQLNKCLKLKPALRNQAKFVNIYLTKLRPNADVNWRHDLDEQQAYLKRLWGFVSTLAPNHNSLKAHVLYHQLVLDERQGTYDKDKLMRYIKLPRPVAYANAKYLQQAENQRFRVNLGADFRSVTQFAPVGTDDVLVRRYLQHFFVDATSYREFAPYLNDVFLKRLFAETKIINGLGDPEQWYSSLPPDVYKQLKERVDLEFAPTNSHHVRADASVSLDVLVKNVPNLIVKVYRINALNYYMDQQRELNTNISLDGLIPNEELTFDYSESPLRRVSRHFEFPGLTKPGVYVIDFIGNGQSSRALIHKGKLRHVVQSSPGGLSFVVFDENNRRLPDASLWMAGKSYAADANGEILVPFSTRPREQVVVLSQGDTVTLSTFQHTAETYSLRAGFYVDRESLLSGRVAKLLVRPGLSLNGVPIGLGVLEDVRLDISSVDQEGVSTTDSVTDIVLKDDEDLIHEFRVPTRLASLTIALHGQVRSLSENKRIAFAASETFGVNQIETTHRIEDLHFGRSGRNYFLDLLGKTGERRANRPVQISVKHQDFRETVNVTLRTDETGRVKLGALADITQVSAKIPDGTSRQWRLRKDRHSFYRTFNGVAGEDLVLPFTGLGDNASRDQLSLIETRHGTFVNDRFDALKVDGGKLVVRDLKAGDYLLTLKESNERMVVRITDGANQGGFGMGRFRQLELRGRNAVFLDSVAVGDEKIDIRVSNASKFSRVHVFATNIHPAFDVYTQLAKVRDAEPTASFRTPSANRFVEGRRIGDEFRYILERKYAQKFPGNMLTRPEMLLNPWAIRDTQTGTERLAEGEAFDAADAEQPSRDPQRSQQAQGVATLADPSNLDFLANATFVALNQKPDDRGIIRIDRAQFDGKQAIVAVVVDPLTTSVRRVSLPEPEPKRLDLRLVNGLDPSKHFSQQKQISFIDREQEFSIGDIRSGRFELYDSISRTFHLFQTLNPVPTLEEFRFILRWNSMSGDEKRELYSKYACHELSFFIQRKDPDFFDAEIQPYLRNKLHRTFMDRYLLEDDLTDYLSPWQYNRLNVVERILLARRIDGEQGITAAHLRNLANLIPPDVNRFNLLFDTAIRGQALSVAGGGGGMMGGGMGGQLAAPRQSLSRNAVRGRQRAETAAKVRIAGRTLDLRRPYADAETAPTEERFSSQRKVAEDKKALSEGLALFGRDGARKVSDQLYRALDKTKEWVESNYYKLPIGQQLDSLVAVDAFWVEFAQHDSSLPFHSIHVAEASNSFTEMMFALAVLDLPFESPKHESEITDSKLVVKLAGPTIAFHQQIQPTNSVNEDSSMLVSQNFFKHGDRYRQVDNQRVDKFVTGEFLIQNVYGCQVVVTNPTSTRQQLDVLVQVPQGAIPVANGRFTRNVRLQLEPYRTHALEYYFYFPFAGKFPHFPVNVAQGASLIASASPLEFNVVKELSQIDRQSWEFVSQRGSNDDVLRFLEEENLHSIQLDRIAFRMADHLFFTNCVATLARRHAYDHTLWSYSVKHDEPGAIRQFLQHANGFVSQCGGLLDSELLTVNPVERHAYQHMEYQPLVNARAHQIGKRRQIFNARFHAQYHRWLTLLSYVRELGDQDRLVTVYYLLLQDRMGEAQDQFKEIEPSRLATRLQYDYCAAYLGLTSGRLEETRAIANRYTNHPVERWRNAFALVRNHLDEIEGRSVQLVDDENRDQVQDKLASTQPSFELSVDAKAIDVRHQNLDRLRLNFYLMDIELLFSRNPFVQKYSGQFSYIQPNLTLEVEIPAGQERTQVPLPDSIRNQNVLVEVEAAGIRRSEAYYSNSLSVQFIENFGQLRVTDEETGEALPTTYVKVYAQLNDGRVQFYKDGYTDLRGRFDYSSLSTNTLDNVSKFSILVLSETAGAIVREADPPKR